MRSDRDRRGLFLSTLLISGLLACGGGSGGTSPTAPPRVFDVTISALASVFDAAFFTDAEFLLDDQLIESPDSLCVLVVCVAKELQPVVVPLTEGQHRLGFRPLGQSADLVTYLFSATLVVDGREINLQPAFATLAAGEVLELSFQIP